MNLARKAGSALVSSTGEVRSVEACTGSKTSTKDVGVAALEADRENLHHAEVRMTFVR